MRVSALLGQRRGYFCEAERLAEEADACSRRTRAQFTARRLVRRVGYEYRLRLICGNARHYRNRIENNEVQGVVMVAEDFA
jgi:hypothetical protein